MRIISQTAINDFVQANPTAEKEMAIWTRVTLSGVWKSPADVKNVFGHRVDFVQVASGNTVAVFDIKNNDWRMITAIHYLELHPEKGRVYILRIFDHPTYDLGKWKQEL